MDNAISDKSAVTAEGHGAKALSGAAECLHLMAAPAFAIMALVTGMSGDGAMATLCGQETSPLGGMAAMYAMMSAFHSAPWLKLISVRHRRTQLTNP